ncbi:MAG TPA: glycosyltransferase family 39 protein [Patescibacteria group bacterium]|nr:glycosyltransferase family 39 protein [Patescibacteria group bacterium]
MMRKHFFTFFLLCILALGLFLRTYRLDSVPFGFFCDEAAIGYNAYTILTKGTDQYNISFPVFFRSFGDYKSPVEIYSTVPSILLFGLNEFSVRVVSALYGVLAIFGLYLLTKILLQDRQQNEIPSFFASLLLAISPWFVHLSRITMEGFAPYVCFTVFGTYCYIRSRGKSWLLVAAAVCFALAMYSYFPSRIFIPLFVIALLCIYRYVPNKPSLWLAIIGIIIIAAYPFVQTFLDGSLFARWDAVNIFNQQQKNESVLQHIAINYIRHFSSDFLFLKGDIDMPGQFITRQSVRGIGELYWFQLPLLLIGSWYLIRKRTKTSLLLLAWFLLYPTGSIFTTSESPYATRSVIGVIPFSILSAIGGWYFFTLIKKYNNSRLSIANLVIFSFVFIASFLQFFYLYFSVYPLYSSDYWGWQYGAKPIVQYFAKHEQQYDTLYMEGVFNGPDIFIPFYAPGNCRNCSIGTPDQYYNPRQKQLFAISQNYFQNNRLSNFKIQKTIYYPDGQTAFLIGTISR